MKKLRLLSLLCLIFAVGCAITSNEVSPPLPAQSEIYTEKWGIIDGIKVDSISFFYDRVTGRKRFAAKCGNDTIWAQRYWRKYERKDVGGKTIITYEDKDGKHVF